MPAVVIPANFLPLGICAELSLYLFLRDDVPWEVFNLSHPKPQLAQELSGVAEQDFGRKLDLLDVQEFEERLKQNTEKELQGQLQENRVISQYFSDAGRIITGYLSAPDTFFTNAKISDRILNYEMNFPPSIKYPGKDFMYLKSQGVLEKFGI